MGLMLAGWVLVFSTGALPAHSETPVATEHEIKAAFLYKFATFIEWPAEAFDSPNAPFVIGILGQDPFGDLLERTLGGKTLDNRPIRFQRYQQAGEVSACHMLFVSFQSPGDTREALELFRDTPILTVGEVKGFCLAGGVIGFYRDGSNIRFEINVDAVKRVEQQGLKIRPQLLGVGRPVREESED
jgi:hypothetical protein